MVIYTRKKKISFVQYLKESLIKQEPRKNQLIFMIISIILAFAMIFVGASIIFLQSRLISLFLGESALQEASSNLNQFIVVKPTILDIFIYGIACFVTIAPNEELFFRGFLVKKMPFSRSRNVLLSSIFFSVYHLLTTFDLYSILYMFLYYFIWGIVFSLIYLGCKEQLLFPIITHGLFDLLLFLL
ncbi:MAG TPA: CPBP family intramembrane glutamic endopeptidase [Candidatus Lokiarchaeia archaeon]|nr:CPBP family intramembrane glutamic endopeptidase [Candidatus Lokiarchaeia archaeon]